MSTPPLAGKLGVVFGVANKRSIAWAIAQAWHNAGARLAFTYQGERLKDNVEDLAGTFGADTPMQRPAQPEEIAPAYVYFASEADSSYITGEVLTLLGGNTTAG